MHYFAYGSNMSLPRLQARLNTVEKLGVYQLKHHRLTFNMLSKDGSGKCNVEPCNNGSDVWGVLFRIDPAEQATLDGFEGLGSCYSRKDIQLCHPEKAQQSAFTYFALRTGENLKPYCWYKHHVFHGATEALLPAHYVQALQLTPAQQDNDPQRHRREMSIYR